MYEFLDCQHEQRGQNYFYHVCTELFFNVTNMLKIPANLDLKSGSHVFVTSQNQEGANYPVEHGATLSPTWCDNRNIYIRRLWSWPNVYCTLLTFALRLYVVTHPGANHVQHYLTSVFGVLILLQDSEVRTRIFKCRAQLIRVLMNVYSPFGQKIYLPSCRTRSFSSPGILESKLCARFLICSAICGTSQQSSLYKQFIEVLYQKLYEGNPFTVALCH